MEDSQIEMTIINLYSDIQENEKEEIIEDIVNALGDASESDLQKLLVEFNSFINNTRLWKLKGKKKIEEIFPNHLKDLEECFKVLSTEEKQNLISLLKKLGTK